MATKTAERPLVNELYKSCLELKGHFAELRHLLHVTRQGLNDNALDRQQMISMIDQMEHTVNRMCE